MIKNIFTPFCDLIISCKPLRFHTEIIIISPRHAHTHTYTHTRALKEKKCYFQGMLSHLCDLLELIVKETTSINYENNPHLHSDDNHKLDLNVSSKIVLRTFGWI